MHYSLQVIQHMIIFGDMNNALHFLLTINPYTCYILVSTFRFMQWLTSEGG